MPNAAQLLLEYVEVESGKNNHLPQLLAAIAEARRVGATLLIAKLDRLSRNAGFIFTLRDAGVDFVCCDMSDANTVTVGLFAVLAQHERETISRRTKDALQAKKARGAQLGTPTNLTDAARANGRAAMQANARVNQATRQAASLGSVAAGAGAFVAPNCTRAHRRRLPDPTGRGLPPHHGPSSTATRLRVTRRYAMGSAPKRCC